LTRTRTPCCGRGCHNIAQEANYMKKERIYYSSWGYDKIEGYSLIPKGEEIVLPLMF